MDHETELLILKEGWRVVRKDGEEKVLAFGKYFPKVHPVSIYLKLYKDEKNPEQKYQFMKAAHDYLWPHTIWHYWTERRFREHCAGWNFIAHAGGASSAKSFDMAKIALIFWFANQKGRRVVVASTTLESAEARVWGYITSLLASMDVVLPFKYTGGKPPKITNLRDPNSNIKDTRHGIYAVSAKKGDSKDTIATWIGVHPDDALLLILDEGTDMPLALSDSMANLDPGKKPFQCNIIGNSDSIYDLHGSMSTPLNGWASIDPMKDVMWQTTQKNGICLYYSPYESPAVQDPDPERRKQLSMFLIDEDTLADKINQYGEDSDQFWRFVMGFWRSTKTESNIISAEFISDFNIFRGTEWSGLYPLQLVGGLDPAFSTGGDKCLLRLGQMGVTSDGDIIIDFQDTRLLFEIKISARDSTSSELQISKQCIAILRELRCPLANIAIDSNGQGRALGGLLMKEANEIVPPIKVYSTRHQNAKVQNSFDVSIISPYELWFQLRSFIENQQIRGLDKVAIQQLTSRLEIKDKDPGKPKKLESKVAYKTRMAAINPQLAHSPDEADVAALAVHLAIMKFGFTPGLKRKIDREMSETEEKMRLHRMQQEQEARGVDVGGAAMGAVKTNPLQSGFTTPLADAVTYKHPLSR